MKHQRIQPYTIPKYSGINEWYHRGVQEVRGCVFNIFMFLIYYVAMMTTRFVLYLQSSVAKKYRKGACENCGAMGHQKKECLERPRKIGARYSNTNIAPDDCEQLVLNQSYDGKRDRWAGYDPSQHKAIIEQFQRIEEAKRQLRAEKLNKGLKDKEVMSENL